jgi:hypothetical protein
MTISGILRVVGCEIIFRSINPNVSCKQEEISPFKKVCIRPTLVTGRSHFKLELRLFELLRICCGFVVQQVVGLVENCGFVVDLWICCEFVLGYTAQTLLIRFVVVLL